MTLTPHSSWNIVDSTKIQSFMDCPRSYFYEYMLGWRPIDANIHLEFGKAWHLAMEHLIIEFGKDGKYTGKAVQEGWNLLNDHYRKFFPILMDESYHPKTPGFALRALAEYTVTYAADQFTPLYTEIAGTVPIRGDKVLHFRMDSILSTPDGVKSREHKTGSQLSRQWTDQWALKIQTGTYNHVLYCLFPEDQVWGVEINGTIFNKTKIQFQRVPTRQKKDMMQTWFWNVNHWVEMIEWEMDRLMSKCNEGDPIMFAFPQNTENCTKYFGCKYHDYCRAWANPLQHLEDIPAGMHNEYWNPADEETEVKNVFTIGQDGLVSVKTKETVNE